MAKQTTKPGDPAPAAKKEKAKKVTYPGLKPDAEDKPTTKLEGWPTDFDPKIHKPLKRSHFNNEAPLLLRRADELEEKAKKLRIEAADVEKSGGKAKKEIKKLRGMMDRFAELKANLEKDGVNTEEFVKMFQEALAGKVEPAA